MKYYEINARNINIDARYINININARHINININARHIDAYQHKSEEMAAERNETKRNGIRHSQSKRNESPQPPPGVGKITFERNKAVEPKHATYNK